MPMPARGLGSRLVSPRALFALTLVTLVLALLAGGGQGSLVESLTALLGLLLMLAAWFIAREPGNAGTPQRAFCLVPAGLLAVPLLQLFPLPYSLWSQLPGRANLAAGLAAAGVDPHVGAWSVSPIATEAVLWSAIVPAGVFMAASVMTEVQRRRLVLVALAFAGLSAFVGLWQLAQGPASALYLYRVTNLGEAVGLFANRNHLASLLAVSLPLAAGMLADRLRQHRQGARDLQVWLLTALIVLLSVAVTATHSRAGFALFMLSVLASTAVLFGARKSLHWAVARPWLQLGAVVAGVMIIQLTLYGMLSRLETDEIDEQRWSLAANTWQAAEPTRGMGYGLGTFVLAYDEIGDASADIPPYVNHAHNDYSELWLEAGLAASLLILGALVLLATQCLRLWREGADDGAVASPDRGVRVGCAFALVLLGLHSIVDYPLRTLTLATLASLLAAVLLRSAVRHSPVERVALSH